MHACTRSSRWVCCLLFLILSSGVSLAMQTRKDSLAQVSTYRQKAKTAINNKIYDQAIEELARANTLVSFMQDPLAKGAVKLDRGILFYDLHHFDKANSEIIQAIIYLKESKNDSLLAEAFTLQSFILSNIGKYDEANSFAKDANTLYAQQNNETGQAKVLVAQGFLEYKMNNFNKAINYLDAALPTLQEFDEHRLLAFVKIKIADSYLNLENATSQNKLQQAKMALADATALIEAHGLDRLRIESYKIKAYIALRENNMSVAEENLARYEFQNDSLQQVYLAAVAKSVDTESNVGDLNEIIATQQDDIDKKQKSINFSRMTTGLSIALIVILSLLTLSLYKNNNLRAKANELLQDKNNELQLAKEKAEKASLAKAQFLSTITHELRTPLYAVTGLTHLLLEENPKPDQKDHLNSLKFSGEYLLSLINNILDLNKLEANKVEIEKTTFNLKKRLNDVLVALKKSAEDRKNNLHFEFDERIPNKLVGDPLKLSQILINLVGNSVKFTQNGDVTVRVKLLEQSGNNKVKLHFEIEDNGVGISRKKQKSIFETFSQASLQINRKFGGTGLGLSIVKNLLELMGSKIHLESQLGKGSKFWFDIAFGVSEEFQEDNNPRNIIYDVDYVALENKSVLVVEDNKINQMITKKILEKNKMECKVADNGIDAIEMIKAENFDVILMDIHMPGISGIEATQKIREFDKQLPIIALTAVTIDENLDDFYRAGFNEIIPKPFKTEEFFEKIYRTLENKKIPVKS